MEKDNIFAEKSVNKEKKKHHSLLFRFTQGPENFSMFENPFGNDPDEHIRKTNEQFLGGLGGKKASLE